VVSGSFLSLPFPAFLRPQDELANLPLRVSENYSQICTIEVDLSRLALQPRRNERGATFFRLEYEIVLMFGLTEFKAQVSYKENGVEKRYVV
jgi:hypothetical protein